MADRLAAPGPRVEREPVSARRRGVVGWADPRGRRLGTFAWALNRITGLGIVLYLFIHLVVLSQLARGPSAWDPFVKTVGAPLFLSLDVLLLAGLLIHGLNGIRVTLVGFGFVYNQQRAMFVALMIIAALLMVIGAVAVFAVE